MLFLVFQLGTCRFALAAAEVVEVLPVVACRPLPHAVPGIAGLFVYRGTPVPLVDLMQVAFGQPCRRRMSTRIILVNYPDEGTSRLLGLLAEQSTEMIRREEADFSSTGVTVENSPYLGPVTRDEQGLIQRMEIDRLLSDEVKAVIFQSEPEAAACR